MAPKNRIIIDTDPGVDDVLAILLALSSSPADLEVLMLSVSYGNVPVQSCLRNVVALFHVLEKEFAWREANGKAAGFDALRACKPLVAVGAAHPLEEEVLAADHFHGYDGLHGVHDECPHLTPADAWKLAFEGAEGAATSPLFTPSREPAHREILRLLRENPPQTISIAVIGPATNLALAAAEDPAAFLRARELVVMGGTFDLPGNITPVAEFNTYADPVAAARVFALTSPAPRSTMPPPAGGGASSLPGYPARLPGRLNLLLFPLDITTPHRLHRRQFAGRTAGLVEAGSPLAEWTAHFMSRTFAKIDSLSGAGGSSAAATDPGLQLHDPMTVWYLLTRDDPRWEMRGPEDIRVETAGQWTRGMHVVDRRGWRKAMADDAGLKEDEGDLVMDEMPGDTGGWLHVDRGNRVRRVVRSPGESVFGDVLLESIFR